MSSSPPRRRSARIRGSSGSPFKVNITSNLSSSEGIHTNHDVLFSYELLVTKPNSLPSLSAMSLH